MKIIQSYGKLRINLIIQIGVKSQLNRPLLNSAIVAIFIELIKEYEIFILF